jgi:serine/threonine protein kinase
MQPGTKLGPYEIVEPIGRGGMGEVYRAWDARLQRHVAIKTVASESATDPQFRERFEREARAVAALSHPNVLGGRTPRGRNAPVDDWRLAPPAYHGP